MVEKAFNIVISNVSTRCCICSLFDNTSPFSTFKPRSLTEQYDKLSKKKPSCDDADKKRRSLFPKAEELRVVVQRVLINLPSTAQEKPSWPSSSGSGESDTDELITCSSCGICVHKCEFRS